MILSFAIAHQAGQLALDAAFDMPRSGVTALFGPSGSGKTTIINAIAGLLKPDSGQITIGGQLVFDQARNINLAPRKRRVGYVFQDARLFPHLSVRGNLYFGHRRSKTPLSAAQCDDVIDLLGLSSLLARMPAHLSGGEKQRVALGRALLANPDILLLDEPLSALDQARKNDILPYFENLRDARKLPILYVSHAIEEVARLADEMVVISQGKILASGPVFDMLGRDDLPPLAGQFDTGTVLAGHITAHDPDHGISHLVCGGQAFVIPLLPKPANSAVRLHIRARDVMIARNAPTDISANNILPVRIETISTPNHHTIDLGLRIGGDDPATLPRLHARITAWSAQRLGLAIGQDVFAVIKSVTADGRIGHDE